jgi:hypothetical protein
MVWSLGYGLDEREGWWGANQTGYVASHPVFWLAFGGGVSRQWARPESIHLPSDATCPVVKLDETVVQETHLHTTLINHGVPRLFHHEYSTFPTLSISYREGNQTDQVDFM